MANPQTWENPRYTAKILLQTDDEILIEELPKVVSELSSQKKWLDLILQTSVNTVSEVLIAFDNINDHEEFKYFYVISLQNSEFILEGDRIYLLLTFCSLSDDNSPPDSYIIDYIRELIPNEVFHTNQVKFFPNLINIPISEVEF